MGNEASKDTSSSGDYDTYYHYTDKDSAIKIAQSGQINQSTDTRNDAVFGKGTYLTKLHPTNDKHDIARNNYDGGKGFHVQKVNDGKVDVAFEVKVRKDKMANHSNSDRDVHKYPGDLRFDSSDVKSVKVHVIDDQTGAVQTYAQ